MRRAVPAALGAACAAAGLAIAAPAALGCDAASHVQAAHAPGRGARPPLVIGDSTLLLAAPTLGRMGIEADAHGCRQFDQGLDILAARRGRRLPDAVVLALGANGPVARSQIARARALLGPHRFLLLVTPREPAASAAAMRAAARAHPDRVVALDWARFSARHGSWFAGDRLHVGPAGARAYARFIRAGLAPFLAAPRHGLRLPARADAPGAVDCGSVRAYGRSTRVVIVHGADRLTCALARRRMAAPRLRPSSRWDYHDWRATGRGPWTDVLARHDRSVVIGGIATMTPCAGSPPSPCR